MAGGLLAGPYKLSHYRCEVAAVATHTTSSDGPLCLRLGSLYAYHFYGALGAIVSIFSERRSGAQLCLTLHPILPTQQWVSTRLIQQQRNPHDRDLDITHLPPRELPRASKHSDLTPARFDEKVLDRTIGHRSYGAPLRQSEPERRGA